jgi:hypothetical protein
LEVLLPIIRSTLSAVQPLRIAECGMQSEMCTRAVLDYAKSTGAHLVSMDRNPVFDVQKIRSDFPAWECIKDFGINGIASVDRCDTILLHEDANWFTTYQSLTSILTHWCNGDLYRFPVVLIHCSEQNGYRDHYRNTSHIPSAYTQETNANRTALYEGTAKNGVRKALEDFCTDHDPAGILKTAHIAGAEGISIIAPQTVRPQVLTLINTLNTDQKELVESLITASAEQCRLRNAVHRTNTDLQQKNVSAQTVIAALVEEVERYKKDYEKKEVLIRHKLDTYGKHTRDIETSLKAANATRATQVTLLSVELEKLQRHHSKHHLAYVHMHNTLSWRITEPLRAIGRLRHIKLPQVKTYIVYAIFGGLKDIWEDFDKPFPHLVRTIRYGVFRKWKPHSHVGSTPPKAPAVHVATKKKSVPAPKPKGKPTVVPKTCNALVYGNDNAGMQKTIESLMTQSLPIENIVALYKAKDAHVQTCIDMFPTVQFVDAYSLDGIDTVTSLPFMCLAPKGSMPESNFVQLGSAFLEENPLIDTVTWNVDDDVDRSAIAIPLDEAVALMQPLMIRSAKLALSLESALSYMPVANQIHSASYPTLQAA